MKLEKKMIAKAHKEETRGREKKIELVSSVAPCAMTYMLFLHC
jgi:hypothetical protein